MDIISEIEAIADAAWNEHQTPLERWQEFMRHGMPDDEDRRPPTRYRLAGKDGLAIRCRLCGGTDGWTLEGEPEHGATPVFVCEHEPVWTPFGQIRQIDSVPARNVAGAKEVWAFDR